MTLLRTTPIIVLDIQASGASPAHGHPIEIAWTRTHPQTVAPAVQSRLVRLPEGAELPRRVGKLTGIAAEDLQEAPVVEDVWDMLRRAVNDAEGLVVAHFARYETAFVNDLSERLGACDNLRVVCTHEIARRIYPDLPRRGLRPLSGFLGRPIPADQKRASAHVTATAFIWRSLVDTLAEQQIHTLAELQSWLKAPAPKRTGRTFPLPRKVRLALPKTPGVYRMLAKGGRPLYVGKATSLKQRVNSYFRSRKGSARLTFELLSQVYDLDCTTVETPLEAALLEHDEIKRLNPPYNVALKRGDRDLVFLSDDFETSSLPSPRHTLGPVPDGPLWSLVVLQGIAGSAERVVQSTDIVNQALGLPSKWREALSAEVLDTGLTLLAETHGLETADVLKPGAWLETVLEIGGAVRRQRQLEAARAKAEAAAAKAKAAAEAELDAEALNADALDAEDLDAEDLDPLARDAENETQGEVRAPRPWTAEMVVALVEDSWVRAVSLLERAEWLCRLSESTLVWTLEDGSARQLVLHRGRVESCGPVDNGQCAIPPGHERSLDIRQRSLDVVTYDRLRVLTTEVRRLLAGPGAVQLCLGLDQTMGRDDLINALLPPAYDM